MPVPENFEPLAPQDALVAVMIATAASDERLTDSEMVSIGAIIDLLPVFRGFDKDRLSIVSGLVAELFEDEDGIDALVGLVEAALPDHLRETAYALACDVAAADGRVTQTEARLPRDPAPGSAGWAAGLRRDRARRAGPSPDALSARPHTRSVTAIPSLAPRRAGRRVGKTGMHACAATADVSPCPVSPPACIIGTWVICDTAERPHSGHGGPEPLPAPRASD